MMRREPALSSGLVIINGSQSIPLAAHSTGEHSPSACPQVYRKVSMLVASLQSCIISRWAVAEINYSHGLSLQVAATTEFPLLWNVGPVHARTEIADKQ